MQRSFGRIDLETSELCAVVLLDVMMMAHLNSSLFLRMLLDFFFPISFSSCFLLCLRLHLSPNKPNQFLLSLLNSVRPLRSIHELVCFCCCAFGKKRPHMMMMEKGLSLSLSFAFYLSVSLSVFLLFMLIYSIRYQSPTIIDFLMGHRRRKDKKLRTQNNDPLS